MTVKQLQMLTFIKQNNILFDNNICQRDISAGALDIL